MFFFRGKGFEGFSFWVTLFMYSLFDARIHVLICSFIVKRQCLYVGKELKYSGRSFIPLLAIVSSGLCNMFICFNDGGFMYIFLLYDLPHSWQVKLALTYMFSLTKYFYMV